MIFKLSSNYLDTVVTIPPHAKMEEHVHTMLVQQNTHAHVCHRIPDTTVKKSHQCVIQPHAKTVVYVLALDHLHTLANATITTLGQTVKLHCRVLLLPAKTVVVVPIVEDHTLANV